MHVLYQHILLLFLNPRQKKSHFKTKAQKNQCSQTCYFLNSHQKPRIFETKALKNQCSHTCYFQISAKKTLIFKTKVQKNQHLHSCHFKIPPKKKTFSTKKLYILNLCSYMAWFTHAMLEHVFYIPNKSHFFKFVLWYSMDTPCYTRTHVPHSSCEQEECRT